MKKVYFILAFLFLGGCGIFCVASIAEAVGEVKGEVKPVVVTKATVPNREEDYQISISSIPRREVLPGEEITYTILYGCSGGNETVELRLEVSWVYPSGEVGEYVLKSASEAYGSAPPDVELSEKKISWRIEGFPPQTTSQRVSFKLRAKSAYKEWGTFPIEVTAHLLAPPFSKEASSLVTVTYPEKMPAVPLTVWRYLRELFLEPSFRFLVSKLALLLLIFILLLTPLIILARLDVRFSFLPYLMLYLWRRFLELLGAGKRAPVWGRVFSEDSHFPVFLVKVSVFDFSGRFLGSCFSDRKGKFGFCLPRGRYLLKVRKGGFVIVSSERFITLSESYLLFKWEPLDSTRGKVGEIYLRKRGVLAFFWEEAVERASLELSDFILILGAFLGLANFYFSPTFLNAALAGFYLFALSLWTMLVFR